jgi:pimeloyl-ACP methyl ester carboxylesterase
MHLISEAKVGFEFAHTLQSKTYRHPKHTGDGGPVLLIPGLGAGNESLGSLAKWISRSGYHPKKSGIRVNLDCSEKSIHQLEKVVLDGEQPLRIIGHSRGGLLAKVLAVRYPELVAGIVTLGSPLVNPFRSLHPLMKVPLLGMGQFGGLLGGVAGKGCIDPSLFIPGAAPGGRVDGMFCNVLHHGWDNTPHCCEDFWRDLAKPLDSRVGFVSIWSAKDGIVSPESTFDPSSTPVQVSSSHCGMAWSDQVMSQLETILPWMS